MDSRQQELLSIIVINYTKTAQPVGSKLIAQRGLLNVSPATIRNEMAQLEAAGYITHPHTSAGRIPTSKGYRYYVDAFIKPVKPSARHQTALDAAVKDRSGFEPETSKAVARTIASLTPAAIFIGFSSRDVYYTGLSNLFSQPEFSEQSVVFSLSRVIDHLDETIESIFNSISDSVDIRIGSENPFGRDCGCVMTKYRTQQRADGIIGILGPVRMDYQSNANLIEYASQLLSNY